MRKQLASIAMCAVLAGVVTIPTHRPAHRATADAAGIGGDWFTDLILEVNNYSATFRKLKWNPFR